MAVIVRIEKIDDKQVVKNYETEKRIFQQRFEKFGEKHLYCNSQRYMDGGENKYARNSGYFFESLKPDSDGNYKLVVAKVLTGRSYESNEEAEWIVPHKITNAGS